MMNVMWVDTTDFTKRIARYGKVQKASSSKMPRLEQVCLISNRASQSEELEKYDGK